MLNIKLISVILKPSFICVFHGESLFSGAFELKASLSKNRPDFPIGVHGYVVMASNSDQIPSSNLRVVRGIVFWDGFMWCG